jgi:hypothetical protein
MFYPAVRHLPPRHPPKSPSYHSCALPNPLSPSQPISASFDPSEHLSRDPTRAQPLVRRPFRHSHPPSLPFDSFRAHRIHLDLHIFYSDIHLRPLPSSSLSIPFLRLGNDDSRSSWRGDRSSRRYRMDDVDSSEEGELGRPTAGNDGVGT